MKHDAQNTLCFPEIHAAEKTLFQQKSCITILLIKLKSSSLNMSWMFKLIICKVKFSFWNAT